jgi:hypothetical protein
MWPPPKRKRIELSAEPAPAPPDQPLDRRLALGMAFGAFGIVFVLWQTESAVLFPFRLMVTFVHEMGHGLAAVLTGGQFLSFHVFGDGSGVAFTDGGIREAIIPAGYLGTALFGALLLYAANRMRRPQWVAFICGAFFITSSLIFGGGGTWHIAAAISSFFAIAIGMFSGIALIALGRYANRVVTVFVLNTLAFIVGFNVFSDFLWLTAYQRAKVGDVVNDAQAMAHLTGAPVMTWIVIWTAAAILMMGIACILAFVEPAARPSGAAGGEETAQDEVIHGI